MWISAIKGENLNEKGVKHARYVSLHNKLNRMTQSESRLKSTNIIVIKNRNVYFKFAIKCFSYKLLMLLIPGRNKQQIKTKQNKTPCAGRQLGRMTKIGLCAVSGFREQSFPGVDTGPLLIKLAPPCEGIMSLCLQSCPRVLLEWGGEERLNIPTGQSSALLWAVPWLCGRWGAAAGNPLHLPRWWGRWYWRVNSRLLPCDAALWVRPGWNRTITVSLCKAMCDVALFFLSRIGEKETGGGGLKLERVDGSSSLT